MPTKTNSRSRYHRTPNIQTEDSPLRQLILGCRGCGLITQCSSPVPWSGPVTSKFLCVGEATGYNEDVTLVPFTGQAGAEFDRLLWVYLSLTRDEVRVTNVVRCRPPDNRDPTAEEITSCKRLLIAEVEESGAEVVVALGATAARVLAGSDHSRQVARWVKLGRWQGWVFPVTHPA